MDNNWNYNNWGYQPQMIGMNTPQQPMYPNPQMAYNRQPQTQSMQQQAMPGLIGKFVENKEIVSITEVPMGGYGIFPKADLSEVYIKVWNNNGTTDICTYTPLNPPSMQKDNPTDVLMVQLMQKLTALDEKIDSLATKNAAAPIHDDNKANPQNNNQVVGGF